MSLFALIHGGAHGGWCWERLVPELEARGYEAVAPDLPFEDESAGAEAWARTVLAAIDASGGANRDDVTLVGHSMGGMCLPVAASMRPVRRMVFLGAMVPVPGRVYAEYLAENPDAITFDAQAGGGTPGASGLSWEAARHGFFHDLDEETARRAFERLRPTSMTVFTETCPIDRWPDVPSTYILMTEDHAVGQEWSRRVAKERINADLIELPGSHSPFYSRPAELADVLMKL
jgi:pimeloyl-ACP methyl ester carboxylesterase